MDVDIGRTSGDDLKALRKALGFRSQSSLSALFHYLGGAAPARSTLSRQEKLPVTTSPELVAFLRLLAMIRPEPTRPAPKSRLPSLEGLLEERFGADHARDQAMIDEVSAEYRTAVLAHLRSGAAMPVTVLDELGIDFLNQAILIAPGTAGEWLLELGFGPPGGD